MKCVLTLIVIGMASVVCGAQGQAQPGDPEGNVFFGASVGLGNSVPDLCDGCQTGLAIGLHGGRKMRPNLALEVEGVFLSVAPNVLSKNGGKHNGLVGAVQYWPTRRLWLKAGAGIGSVERHTPDASSKTTHPAGMAGAGIDLNPGSRFLLDLSVLALLTGDSEGLFADEPAHKAVMMTPVFQLGFSWRSR